MRREDLLSAVQALLWPDSAALTCGEPGHPAGHTCLFGADPAELPDLADELSGRYGAPTTPPAPVPLLTPEIDDLAETYVWTYGGRRLLCATLRTPTGPRLLVRVAVRPPPSADALPASASPVERLAAVTEWTGGPRRTTDWAAAEARLGTALPSDYKALADLFGPGAFDGFVQLYLPDDPYSDLVEHAEHLTRFGKANGTDLWRPYGLHPTPGGLLQWADTEQADGFYWITDGPDPDRWPIVATADDHDFAAPFHGSTATYLHTLLTDPSHPFSTARYFSAHWFQT